MRKLKLPSESTDRTAFSDSKSSKMSIIHVGFQNLVDRKTATKTQAGPRLIKKEEPLNNSTDYDKQLKDQFFQYDYAVIDEMIQQDQKNIQVMNQDALDHNEEMQELAKKPIILKKKTTTKFGNLNSPGLNSPTLKSPLSANPMDHMKPSRSYEPFLEKMRCANQNLMSLSRKDFMSTIRTQDQMLQYKSLYRQPTNVYLTLLQSQQDQVPKMFGLVQNTNTLYRVNGSRYIRKRADVDSYSQALSSKQCKTITSIELNNNKYQPNHFSKLLYSFPLTLRELDLMDSELDYQHMNILVTFLRTARISKINLENNKIRDQGCIILLKNLVNHVYLTSLNLNRNSITSKIIIYLDISSNEFSMYLKENQNLTELYLNYNNLSGRAGIAIWKALYKNTAIKILDISHNSIASDECVQHIIKAITRPYNELLHVDISYNKFNQRQGLLIKQALDKNDSIFGFHFDGNATYSVNTIGFMVDKTFEINQARDRIREQSQKPQVFTLLDQDRQQIRTFHEDSSIQWHVHRKIISTRSNEDRNTKGTFIPSLDVCWICQGWQEIKFMWTPHKSGSMDKLPIFLHLDFENYRPLLMMQVGEHFQLMKMCPPNREIRYFFTNPVLSIQTTAKDQVSIELSPQEVIPQQAFLYNGDLLVYSNSIQFVNHLHSGNDRIFDRYLNLIVCKPRQVEPTFDFFNCNKEKNNQWSIETSIFKYFQPDNSAVIDECFEFDYSCGKTSRLVKEVEIDAVKEYLRALYPKLFNAYKYYISSSTMNIPCITMNSFMDLLFQLTIQDDGLLKNNDVEISFTSTNNKDINYAFTQDKALVRFQFLEVFVRLSMDKYIRNGICQTALQSLQQLCEKDGFNDLLSKFDTQQEWRYMRYWLEDCDKIIKNKLPFLKLLYRYTCKLNPKEEYSKLEFVQVKDFKDLCNRCNLISNDLSDRETYLCYLLSMMTQVDELNNPRHFQMNFYEFLEALARLAEKLSIIRNKEMDVNERRSQLLHRKLDGLFIYLYLQLKDIIRPMFKDDRETAQFDKCMIKVEKTLQQKLEDSFTDEDEKPYDPIVEMPHLQAQCIPVATGPPKRGGKRVKVSFLSETKFTMLSFVQYFNSFDQ